MLSKAMAKDANDGVDGAHEPLLPYAGANSIGHDPRKRDPASKKYIRWILYGVLALVVLVLVRALAKIPVRSIAKSSIRDAQMTIKRMQLMHPQASNVTLNITLVLTSPSAFGVQIDPTTFMLKYGGENGGEGQAVGSLVAPKMEIHNGENIIVFPNSTLAIDNRTAWDAFAHDMIQKPDVQYTLVGALGLHIRLLWGIISFDLDAIPFNKTLSFKGLDGMKKMQIADIDMTASTPTQVVAKIRTCLYNPSITTMLPVGKLCLRAHYPTVGKETLVAALATSADASISVGSSDASHPECASLSDSNDTAFGYNLLELEGVMLGTNQDAISGLISKYLSNTPAQLTVVACHPQATSVDIYNQAMQTLSIPAILPPQKDPLVGKLFFQSLALDPPDKVNANVHLGINTALAVEATSPLGPNSALTLSEIHMSVKLYARKQLDEVLLGELSALEVDIVNGRLVERSNITVNCTTELRFEKDGAPFGEFVRDAVVKDTVDLRLEGHLNVVAHDVLKLSGLPLNVTTTLVGMHDFNNVSIIDFLLPGGGDPSHQGEVIKTDIAIWNPSLFAVSIGALEMELGMEATGESLGQLHGRMVLTPGDNRLPMQGTLLPKRDSGGRVSDAVADFFSKYLRSEPSNVAVTITGSEYPDCIWLQKALIGMKIGTVFPGVKPGFQLISGINMTRLDVVLKEDDTKLLLRGPPRSTNTQMLVRTSLGAQVKMPPSIQIPLNITNLSIALTMENDKSLPLGTLISGREVCEFNQTDGGAFRLNMSTYYPIKFNDNDQVAAMAGFITDLLTKEGNIVMQLASDPKTNQGAFPFVETRMGMLPLQRIPIKGAPLIPGMNSFTNPPVEILGVDIEKGLRSLMVLTMKFSIRNPSVVQTKLGSLQFDVLSENARMGAAHIEDFDLKCCGEETILSGKFDFAPADADLSTARRFLSNFVSGYFTGGKAQKIAIRGTQESTTLDILQPALKALTIPSMLPTLADLFPKMPTLVASSVLYTPSILHLSQIPTALRLQNPFSESILVTAVDLELYPCEDQSKVDGKLVCDKYYTEPLAHFAPSKFAPMFVPANSPGCFTCCQGVHCEQKLPICPRGSVGECMHADVDSFFSPEAIAALFHSATSGLLMKVNGTIGASIGDYATQLWYQQEGLLVSIAKW
uniref:Uncharacterized protein n=1 Tax=Globisporangium ultimum (strain ATCC 200006 / CBS 805.95 / DAOM BR144) TaxID=431595 RepID=K3X8D0_GLOUD